MEVSDFYVSKDTTSFVIPPPLPSLPTHSLPSPQNYGFTKLTANSTTLVWEYIHNDDNKVYDSFVLTKSDGSGSVGEDVKERDEERNDSNQDSADDDKNDPQMGMSPNEL